MTQLVLDVFRGTLASSAVPVYPNWGPRVRDREEIAASAARKIVNTPAVTEEYVRAIILDGLNEAADIERHCADVDREVFGN